MTERITFAFAGAQPQVDGGHAIYPMSMLFRTGDYADKKFPFDAADLAATVAAFKPVGGNIEHTNFLKGRACEVRRVWADGDMLKGEVAVPTGLDALLTDDERKLSCEFDRATKQLSGIALCMKPRVSDAALMSELAGSSTTELEDTLVQMAGKRHSQADQDRLDAIAEHAVALGAEPPKGQAKMSAEPTSILDTIKALLGMDTPPVIPALPAVTPKETVPMSTTTPAAETPREKELRERLEAMEARFSTSIEAGTQTRAQQYADAAITANRAYPAQRDALTALFAQAIRDDAANAATITFGVGDAGKGGRLDALVGLVKATPAHSLTTETVPENITALFGGAEKTSKQADEDEDVKQSTEWAKKNLRRDA